jgi:hypothetical protein
MITKEALEQFVKEAEQALLEAEQALADYNANITQHIYPDIETATGEVEDLLYSRARQDCEGQYNCGSDEYFQGFVVDGQEYLGTLRCFYNRHDKTYYFVEESTFSWELIGPYNVP